MPAHSLSTGPRKRLISERRFLAFNRSSRADLGGLVLRRTLGTWSASASSSTNRSVTLWRFCSWLRLPPSASRSCPSELIRLASLSSTLFRCCSVRLGESSTSHTSSTRVEDVFTCCPPGPPAREARKDSSDRGMETDSVIRSGGSVTTGASLSCDQLHVEDEVRIGGNHNVAGLRIPDVLVPVGEVRRNEQPP